MFLELEYAYAALCFPFGVVWVLFYYFSPENRAKLLKVSITRAPFGILLDCIYTSDYWRPKSFLFVEVGEKMLMAESFLFAFFLSGIAAIAYKVFFRKVEADNLKQGPSTLSVRVGYFAAIIFSLVLMKLGVNSIYSTAICYGALGVALVVYEPKLLPCSFFTSSFVSVLMFAIYLTGRASVTNIEEILRSWWLLYDTGLDHRIFNIPLTELIWGLGYGFTAGARQNML